MEPILLPFFLSGTKYKMIRVILGKISVNVNFYLYCSEFKLLLCFALESVNILHALHFPFIYAPSTLSRGVPQPLPQAPPFHTARYMWYSSVTMRLNSHSAFLNQFLFL